MESNTLTGIYQHVVTQTNVSRLESPGYGRLNITTLQRIASVFDVALIVRFVPFSELIRWTDELSPEVMAPQSFEEELPQLERFGTAVMPQWNIGSSEPLIPTNVVALGHNRFTVQYRIRGDITLTQAFSSRKLRRLQMPEADPNIKEQTPK